MIVDVVRHLSRQISRRSILAGDNLTRGIFELAGEVFYLHVAKFFRILAGKYLVCAVSGKPPGGRFGAKHCRLPRGAARASRTLDSIGYCRYLERACTQSSSAFGVRLLGRILLPPDSS